MSLFRRLLGTEKAIENITDKDNGLLVRAGGWVDGLHHTDQERSEAAAAVREWGLKQLEALEPFKVVQRILAFSVAGIWALSAINVLIAIWVEALWPSIQVKEAMLKFILSDFIVWPVVMVMSLYFAGGVLPGVLGRKQ